MADSSTRSAGQQGLAAEALSVRRQSVHRLVASCLLASLVLASPASSDPVSELRDRWRPRLLSEYSREHYSELCRDKVPPTARDRASFLALTGVHTPIEVFRKVGLPDADLGSGVHLFRYALSDGAVAAVWAATVASPATIRLVEADSTVLLISAPATEQVAAQQGAAAGRATARPNRPLVAFGTATRALRATIGGGPGS